MDKVKKNFEMPQDIAGNSLHEAIFKYGFSSALSVILNRSQFCNSYSDFLNEINNLNKQIIV